MVFFTGISGSGKSSVGKRVAAILRCNFIDTDRLIEKQTGLEIAEIFRRYGERYFRRVEKEVIERLTMRENICVALGGGSITIPAVRAFVKKKQWCGLR